MDIAAELVTAWVIASPVIIVVLAVALVVSRSPVRRPLESWPFWEMQPGRRYHVEIWPLHAQPFDFIDEFIGFHQHEANFLLWTVHRQVTDQVRVTPLPPPKRRKSE